MTLSGGHAVMPEQSTVAIIAHHPQAVYFGMKSGFVPEDKRPDELIAGTIRGGDLPPEVIPPRAAVEAEVPSGRGSRLGPRGPGRWACAPASITVLARFARLAP